MLLPLILTVFALLLATYIFRKRYFGTNILPKRKSIPGLSKSDEVLGNLQDIFKAGGLPKFLGQLHEKYGPIASYWHKDVYTVSLGDPKYFKFTEKMFDRHPAMFEFALPLISEKSMQFQNGEFGRNRYKLLSQPFGFSGCSDALFQMNDIVQGEIANWKHGDMVGLHDSMMKLAIAIITKTHFGCHFEDAKNVATLSKGYSTVMTDFDDALLGIWSFGQGDSREKEFEKNLESFKQNIKIIVKAHIDRKNSGDYDLAPFLDTVLDNIDDEDDIIHQAITFLIGGFHTSGTYMTWFFYNLGLNLDIQEKVRKEIKSTLSGHGLKSMEDIDKLTYTKRVMDETLRHMKVGTFSERKADKDVEIGGFFIPEGSQIVNSLCLTLDDKSTFPNPEVFDPDNFQNTKSSKSLAFSPFGFGIRKCPGYRFANMEMVVAAVEVLSRFKVVVIDNENVVKPVYGFVTKPDKECWVKIMAQ